MKGKKKNIILHGTEETMKYASLLKVFTSNFPQRNNIYSHADYIKRRLTSCYELTDRQRQAVAIKYKDGVYLEFASKSSYDLAIKSLENLNQGIRLLNVKHDEVSKTTKATVYIPEGKQHVFLKKIESYATETTKNGSPKNNDLISSIEDVKLAMVESFWIGKSGDIPSSVPEWCEIWLRYNDNNDYETIHSSFESICNELNIQYNNNRIKFPERTVRLIKVNRKNLEDLMIAFPFIAEFRRAAEPTSFFEELSISEKKGVISDILSRTTYNDSNISICILDTGLTANHPLIEPALASNNAALSLDTKWGAYDHNGHGTEMAGISLFNDLSDAYQSNGEIIINHKLESIKILPPTGENRIDLYGSITEQAIALAEIENPTANRIICMAVTSNKYNTSDGSPTAWSAAIDNITSGANEEGKNKRLFFISAGNVFPYELYNSKYPDANIIHTVESPGQSWNALTVGAYSDRIRIDDPFFKDFYPVADVEELCPYSSTSMLWETKWPIKPEILFSGGNMATNGDDFSECEDLELLTTGKDLANRPLSTTYATSSATAQAANMAAKLYSEYPNLWPETIRALLVHSANWTDKMISQFCREDTKTKGRKQLLRTCGYGIPNLDKAIQCANNSVNLVIESELQPYMNSEMNEMHLHTIPWPKSVLLALGETKVKLKVTLSYFIEPGPGEVGWKYKYRYASSSLRFDVINSNESLDDFKKRINSKMRGDDKKDSGEGSSRDWYLGTQNRDVGSIHSDYCETTAADLAEANKIAVFPVIGWWRERKYLGRSNNKIRYSLIISIETPDTEVDLYTPIINQIKPEIEIAN